MKVKELIEYLQELVKNEPELANLEVIYSKDPEGNGFHRLDTESGGTMAVADINDYYLDPIYEDEDEYDGENKGTEVFCIN